MSELKERLRQAVSVEACEKASLIKAKAELLACDEACEILQAAGESVQKMAHARIAETVTRCLRAVFEEPYTFEVRFEKKRGRTEARLVFVKGGNDMHPLNGGFGVLDVAALALRCACLVLSRPAVRRLLILDEPFRHVHQGRRPRVAALMEALAAELGIQFLIVSHDQEFQVGKVIQV